MRALCAFAAALALVACADQGPAPEAPPQTQVAPGALAPRAPTPETPVAAPAPVQAPEGLTPAAAETYARIKAAADAGDAAGLVAVAAETPGFAYTFGAEEDFAAYIAAAQMAGRDPVAELAGILALPPGETMLDGRRVFHWPYFYPWEAARYDDQARADAAAIVGEEAAAQISDELAYLGPRAGIDETGQWLFYVTGD